MALRKKSFLTRRCVDVVDGAGAEAQHHLLQANLKVLNAHSLILAVNCHSINELLDGIHIHFEPQVLEDLRDRVEEVFAFFVHELDGGGIGRHRQLEDLSFNVSLVSVVVSDDLAQKGEVLVENVGGVVAEKLKPTVIFDLKTGSKN